MLYLEAQTLEGIQALDSVKLKASGEFAFAQQKKVENPEFYALRIGNRRINFSVDSTETINFNIKNTPNALTYDVQGSYNSQKIKEICEQQARLQQQIIAIEKNEALLPGDVVDSINGLVDAYKEKMKTNTSSRSLSSPTLTMLSVSPSPTSLAHTNSSTHSPTVPT